MTYSAGSVILVSDINTFNGNVNAVWNTAYGQPALANVTSTDTVTASTWASLNNTVANAAYHQGTSITSRTSPVAGNVISVLANISTDITSIGTNAYNAYSQGTQYTAWTGTASKTTNTGNGAGWTITFTDTVTFANTTAAANFFNAGGTVKIQFSKTSTGHMDDTEWNHFVNDVCGAVYLSSTGASKTINSVTYTGTTVRGGTGTPTTLATTTGYAQLTGNSSVIYKQFDSGYAYTDSYVQVAAQRNGAVLTFVTTWYGQANYHPYTTPAQISGGTATTGISFGTPPATVVTYFPPETTYLTNTWGTPTVASTVS